MPKVLIKVRGNLFARLRREKRLSQRQVADMMRMTEGRVSKIETAEVANVTPEKFGLLAKGLGMEPDRLEAAIGMFSIEERQAEFERGATMVQKIREEAEAKGWDGGVEQHTLEWVPEVPVFDMSVAAGQWVDVSEFAEVRAPGMIDHGRFRIRIAGDSMQPVYKTGDLVEFRCMREGRGDVLEVGKDYYVQLNDGRATFKMLEKIGDEVLTFRALNKKKYKDQMPVRRDEIVRMARATAKVQLLD